MIRLLIRITALFTLLGILGTGCSAPSEPVRLDPENITQYQGIDLTPADSLRENSIKGVQDIDLSEYTLKISGWVDEPLVLRYDDVLKHTLYEKVVTLHCVEGWQAVILWEGVLLRDVLEPAAPRPEGVTVIFHAHDGYTTSLPLTTIMEKDILLAHKANGEVLPARLGFPFIVVAEDRLGYKWARWVTEIELSSDADYKGFWEQRGYSNEAEVSLP